MHSNIFLSPLAVAIAVSLAAPVQAAEPISLQHASFGAIQQQFPLSLSASVAPGARSGNQLQFIKDRVDQKQVRHARFQQYYAGVPVFGGYAIMHHKGSRNTLMNAKTPMKMNGTVYQNLEKDLGHPDASFHKNAALALAQFKSSLKIQSLSEESVSPLVYIDQENKAHWAYKVSVLVSDGDSMPERPTAIIDATTHEPFVQWNDIKTEKTQAFGRGFGGNRKVGQYEFGSDLRLLEITRDSETEQCFMENKDVKVINMSHRYSAKSAPMKFACRHALDEQNTTYYTGAKGDGYDKDNGAASPSNDALYAGYVIKHMYQDWYGVEALTKPDGTPMQLVMRVHYGRSYENAYWDGKQMTFGCGESMMYPLVSLGVGGHEVSHGFTEQHSGLEYFGHSGGMNESFSDMAAQAAEFYSVGKSSWQIGAEIMKEDSGYDALRYMDKPSRDGDSIDRATDYTGGLDVHYSSGVFNRLFYLMAQQPGWDTRKTFDVMVKANMDYWTPYSTFDEGGCGVLHAAKDLGYSLDDVKSALTEVAINFQSCKLED